MEEWKAKAIGTFSPSYSSKENSNALFFFGDCLSVLKKESVKVSRINEVIRSHLQGENHRYKQEEINSTIEVIPDIIEKLESLKLIERHKDVITSIQTKKILEIAKDLDFIKKSVERRIAWICYYFYHHGKYIFSADDIRNCDPTLHENQIEKMLDRNIIQWQKKGMMVERKENNYVIGRDQNDKLIRECIISGIEYTSRRSSEDLEWDILALLDHSPYSNNDLARILEVDKGQISRKIKQLRDEDKFIKAAEVPSSRGHQYWLTNCNNCPWRYTKKQCRNNSIETLTEICKQRYGLDLDPSYLEQIENNQTLVHLVDLFEEIPNQNIIEKEKRVFLSRVFHDIINKIGKKNIEVTDDHEYWIKK